MTSAHSIPFSKKLTGIFAGAVLCHSASLYFLEFGSVLLLPVVGLIGILALAFAAAALFKHRNRSAALVLAAVGVIWAAWVLLPTRELSMYARFWSERGKYSAAVSELAKGQQPTCLSTGACQLDVGPPARLAFSWGGIIDNWVGVVYDPTEDIVNTERHKEVFGGDLIGCKRIAASYFLCSFT